MTFLSTMFWFWVVAFSSANFVTTSAVFRAASPFRPFSEMTVHGTWFHVTLLLDNALANAWFATIFWFWVVTLSDFHLETTTTFLATLTPFAPFAELSVHWTVFLVTTSFLYTCSHTFLSTVRWFRVITFTCADLVSSTTFLCTFRPSTPSRPTTVHWGSYNLGSVDVSFVLFYSESSWYGFDVVIPCSNLEFKPAKFSREPPISAGVQT